MSRRRLDKTLINLPRTPLGKTPLGKMVNEKPRVCGAEA